MTALAYVWGLVDPLLQGILLRATAHGYISLAALACLEGVGFPIPAELVILSVFILIRQDDISFWPALVLTASAYTAGTIIPYALGRWGGRALIRRLLPSAEARRARLEAWISGSGVLTLTITRFTGFFRLAAIVMAGVFRMPVLIALPTIFGSTFIWLYSSYHLVRFADHRARRITESGNETWLVVAGVVAVVAGCVAIYIVRRRRARGAAPDG